MRKDIEDIDLLNYGVAHNDEVRVHGFMFLISLSLIVLSALTVHDDFVVDILEELRFEKFGWEPKLCKYDESEKIEH